MYQLLKLLHTNNCLITLSGTLGVAHNLLKLMHAKSEHCYIYWTQLVVGLR